MTDPTTNDGDASGPLAGLRSKVGEIPGAPEKTALLSLSTLDPDRAVLELCDNSIDAARVNELSGTDIELVLGEDYLEIRDSSGGIPEDSLDVWLTLGASRQTDADGYSLSDSIGWAGVGAIEASLSIGQSVMLASRAAGADQGYAYYIDEEYLETDDWSLDYYEYDGLDPGQTIVRIEDLTIGHEDLYGDYDTLPDLLSTTYELYLADTTTIPWADNTPVLDVDLTVVDEVNNRSKSVMADVSVDWSYLNFDSAHPRAYQSFELANETTTGRVRLDIICGLSRTKHPKSGVHLYANGRKIFDGETSYEAGFGFQNGLNQFRSERHGRLVILVLVRSLDSPRDIPTENNKTTLRDGSDTTKAIKKRVGRTGLMYMHLADVHRVPTPMSEAYPGEQTFASNGGQIELLDYSENQDVRDHPGGKRSGRYYELEELETFKQITKRHAKLCLSCPDVLKPRHRPAYHGLRHEDLETEAAVQLYDETKGFLHDRFDAFYDADKRYWAEPVLVEQDELPPMDVDVNARLETLEQLARRHAQADEPFRYLGMKPWERPYYLEQLYQFAGLDPEELPAHEHLPPEDKYLYEHGVLPEETTEEDDVSSADVAPKPSSTDDTSDLSFPEYIAANQSAIAAVARENESEYETVTRMVEGYASLASMEELDDIPIEAKTPEEKLRRIVARYREIVGLTKDN
ncbi:ATP-binding protein [Halobacterium zhouii]|uniref:ATP-binding protein n=1 Tax=Halobacterium zhouii TaxID=2902624 RepID=UPI001E2FA685|nr:ATP-binding protein [Halobacterium zhouii]